MFRRFLAAAAALLLLCLTGCSAGQTPPTSQPTEASSAPTEPEAVPTESQAPDLPTPGWLVDQDNTYYVREDGTYHTGWLELPEGRFYLDDQGRLCTGWTEIDGVTVYLNAVGAPQSGWLETADGRYYLSASGTPCTGWTEVDGTLYYFRADGTMAQGQVEIDGVNHFFTADGASIVVVNPWNAVPEDYTPDLVEVHYYYATADCYVDSSCYDALIAMLSDCNELSGARVCVVSGYRSYQEQTWNFNRKVNSYLSQGYSQEEAEAKAATAVAVPGTSEHHLGLAVDIIDTRLWELTYGQADLSGQQWLMEHCWEYGFILRYPQDKTDVTGIIYEPWHYRYVGTELSAQLHESGLTLEEYIASLTK